VNNQNPTVSDSSAQPRGLMRSELALGFSILTAIIFQLAAGSKLLDLSNPLFTQLAFASLFGVMLWSSFAVVRHADCLAVKLGEPYGTLILTVSVISIEVVMVSAVMLTGAQNPTLGRDMMFSVLMIVLNGMVGVSLLLGGYRHLQQPFNLQGANTFIAVLLPLAVLSLILPNYTLSTEDGSFSLPQAIFLILMSLGLYGVFLGIQTMRHRDFFMAPPKDRETATEDDAHDHAGLVIRSVGFHAAMLLAYMVPIVFLSKKMAVIIDYGISVVGAPVALGGLIVAVLVLAPEALAAFRAALSNQLQRSVNICLGSALATIGLTVPAVLLIGLVTGEKVILGLGPVDAIMLVLTLLVCIVNFSSGRSNVLQGVIHLLLFCAYAVLIFD
jgi:Ca2+:H+ antiporter